MADETGIVAVTLANYLKDRDPTVKALTKIADTYNVSLDWLVGRTDVCNSGEYSSDNSQTTNESINNHILNPTYDFIFNMLNDIHKYISDLYIKDNEKMVQPFHQK